MQDALGTMQSVLVLGGASEIALATMHRLAADGTHTVILAARRPDTLEPAIQELRKAGVTTVAAMPFDATAPETHEAFVDDCVDRFGDFDLVLLAFGVLGDQTEAERDGTAAAEIAGVNYLGAVSVTVPIAQRLRVQGHGAIVALSSVAGERARRSNFVYGSSKAGLDAFFQGLGDSLVGTGVHVMVVRPGFVHTRMTKGLEPAPFATTPEVVADAIVAGLARRAEIVWVPPVLRYVMSALRHLPRSIFRRLPV